MNPIIGIDVTFDAAFISVPCDPHISAWSMDCTLCMIQIPGHRYDFDCLISRRCRADTKRY